MRIFKGIVMAAGAAVFQAVSQTVSAVQSFSSAPLDSLGIIIPALAGGISFLRFIAAYIQFITGGGYRAELGRWREGGEGMRKSFIAGTAPLMYKGFPVYVVMALLAAAVVVIVIIFFTRESAGKRLLMTVELALLALSFGAVWLLNKIFYTGTLELSEEQWLRIGEIMESHNLFSQNLMNRVLIAAMVLTLLFFLLAFFADSKEAVVCTLSSAFISFVLLPLALVLLENIITIAAAVIMALLFSALVGGLMTGMGEGGGSSSDSWGGGGLKDSSGPKKGTKNGTGGNGKAGGENQVYVDRGVFEIYKVHEAIGPDTVRRENRVGGMAPTICTVPELRRGQVRLYDKTTKREIKESDIPWKN